MRALTFMNEFVQPYYILSMVQRTVCTVEPFLKDTHKIRTPLHKGHFATCIYVPNMLSLALK